MPLFLGLSVSAFELDSLGPMRRMGGAMTASFGKFAKLNIFHWTNRRSEIGGVERRTPYGAHDGV